MPPILLLTAFALLFGCSTQSTFTDERDGKEYKTVKIGEQVWMAENLNYGVKWSVCYDNKAENCAKYGRLYNWDMAMKACPKGWHLPDSAEWQMLVDFAGGEEIARKKLKAAIGWSDYSVWNDKEDKSGNGTDDYGFAALPGGHGFYEGFSIDIGYEVFIYIGYNGVWWSASERSASHAYFRSMLYYNESAGWGSGNKTYLQSVRCVRD